jgi:hypothetical protein
MGRLSTALAALVLAPTALAATAAPVSAATIPPWSRAFVTCDSLGNYLDLTPKAGGPANVNQSTVWYRYAIYDQTRAKYVPGWGLTNWGSFTYTRTYTSNGMTYTQSQMFGLPDRAVLPDGSYSVYVQYAWLIGGAWVYSPDYNLTNGWTNTFTRSPYGTTISGYSCSI